MLRRKDLKEQQLCRLKGPQLFLHYNRIDGPFEYNEETDKFDGRPILGLTPNHRNLSSKEVEPRKLKTQKIKKTSKVIE